MHPLTAFRYKRWPPLSKSELARMLGLSRSYIHRIENGERQFSPDIVGMVSKKTGISREQLRPDLALMRERALQRLGASAPKIGG